ncbi:MAG: hypothetical protein LBU48_04820 [Coriobacteriales bacterium]|nr:hypothetical protein [Coriobacteriales bacterium]
MNEFFAMITTSPWGLAVVLFGLMAFFAVWSLLSERRTRKMFPDQDRRGTKAVAKKKKKAADAKKAASAQKNGNKKASTSPSSPAKKKGSAATAAKPKKKAVEKEPEEEEETLDLQGFFGALWGNEETGEKGLLEKMWETGDEDEDESEKPKPKKKAAATKPKDE